MRQDKKNISKNIPNGRTLQTRDENFFGQSNYKKPGYEGKGNYRKVVVIDSNDLDELAVVKLTKSEKGIILEYSNGKSRFKPYVETLDSDNLPIRVGKKFIENPSKLDLSSADVTKIKKEVFTNKWTGQKNRSAAHRLKGRK